MLKMNKMGSMAAVVVVVFFFLLLLCVASAREAYKMPAAGRRAQPAGRPFPVDLMTAFRDPATGSEISTDFSRSCLEISRRAKEFVNDQSLIDEIDSLASTLCHPMMMSQVEEKLKSNDTCTVCRNILDTINRALGDTEQQLAIIVYLLKACEIQTVIEQCKKLVFAFGPIALGAVQTVVSKDLCYMVHICEEAKNQTTNMTQYWDITPRNIGDLSSLT